MDNISETVEQEDYFKNQRLQGYIYQETPLGYKVCVEDKFFGLLYHEEVFGHYEIDQNVDVFIKKIRDDGKVDLSLQKIGYREAAKDTESIILNTLEDNNGFLDLTDKSLPSVISSRLGISKKKYKNGIGTLYKKKVINLEKDGIRLI